MAMASSDGKNDHFEGIHTLPDEILCDSIMILLDPRSLAALSCASSRVFKLAQVRQLWQKHCVDLYAYDVLEETDKTFAMAYRRLRLTFGKYAPDGADAPRPSVFARAKHAWNSIENSLVMSQEDVAQDILKSLAPGVTEAELDALEKFHGKMPDEMRVIYRIHNGQELEFDNNVFNNEKSFTPHRSIAHGLFGGYLVYNQWVNMRMLPTRHMRHLSTNFNKFVISTSFNGSRKLYVNAQTSKVHFEQPLPAPTTASRGSVLDWFEEFAKRLTTKMYDLATLGDLHPTLLDVRAVSLFPNPIQATSGATQAPSHPSLSIAVTNGVKVVASVVCMPEAAQLEMREAFTGIRHMFAYSISFSLVGGDGDDDDKTQEKRSVQLISRHWRFREPDGKITEVNGPGVIGHTPILQSGDESFVYQSQTSASIADNLGNWESPRMSGYFVFVEGTIAQPRGPEFRVDCGDLVFTVEDDLY